MWHLFTERARRVIFFAQEEAARFGSAYVDEAHITLALMREEDCVAGRILVGLGVPDGYVRGVVEPQLQRRADQFGQDMQLTPAGKGVVDFAHEESRQLNNKYIGTEHLLLGTLRNSDSAAARALAALDLDLERVRAAVIALQVFVPGNGSNTDPKRFPVVATNEIQQLLVFASLAAQSQGRASVEVEDLLAALLQAKSKVHEALSAAGVDVAKLSADLEARNSGSELGEARPITTGASVRKVLAAAFARFAETDLERVDHLLVLDALLDDETVTQLLEAAGGDLGKLRELARRRES